MKVKYLFVIVMHLKVLKINELLLCEFDVNVELYESINLKWKLGIYFDVEYNTVKFV
jgi:hypothetical protein